MDEIEDRLVALTQSDISVIETALLTVKRNFALMYKEKATDESEYAFKKIDAVLAKIEIELYGQRIVAPTK